MVKYRRAVETDRNSIACCIVDTYENDFKDLKKPKEIIVEVIEGGIQLNRFFVAEDEESGIVGILAISDCNGRSLLTDKEACKEHFGYIKGNVVAMLLKGLYEKPLDYHYNMGYIEFVGVLDSHKQKDLFTKLLDYAVRGCKYTKYEVEFTNLDVEAFASYEKYGFKESKRIKEKNPKKSGFEEKIYMYYHK